MIRYNNSIYVGDLLVEPMIGECPDIDPDTVGTCVELCGSDTDCSSDEKCCSNGCGHVCTKTGKG